jgi:hypothetical protein
VATVACLATLSGSMCDYGRGAAPQRWNYVKGVWQALRSNSRSQYQTHYDMDSAIEATQNTIPVNIVQR